MNQEAINALQLITGKNHIDDVSVEELQQLADESPYFAAAHLILTKKMQQVHHPDLQKQLYRTALYFPNEQWLRYLLLETADKKTDEIIPTQQPNSIDDNGNKQSSYISNITTDFVDNDIAAANETTDIKTAGEAEDSNIITLPAEAILEQVSVSNNISDEPEEIPLDEEELQQQSEPLPIEESQQKIASLLSGQAEAFHKPMEEKTDVPIGTEPFHTVDYFASQGIKLDGKKEDNSFDRKVHKFTDWLRQMKRINPHPADLGTEAEQESYVANTADSSNYTKEIVTESMADVLLKQGKKDKAVEIYHKLSLLYPHKNTYFAALIQEVK